MLNPYYYEHNSLPEPYNTHFDALDRELNDLTITHSKELIKNNLVNFRENFRSHNFMLEEELFNVKVNPNLMILCKFLTLYLETT